MGDVFLGFRPRPSDILIAIMGMTGSGKSTFISLCTGQDVPVGHDLQACTQHVTAYQCKWSDTSDIYLLDTPGFDDTNRSDTEVLKEIALCLAKTYEDNVKLSGILYLHRITDRRMGGSAQKNLMMFRKLCGKDSLKNVILVTTMWEAENAAMGEKREQELIATDGFWGALVEEGAQVNRHNNTLSSAMSLLKTAAKNNRVTISIQKEMVSEHKDLNETEAGIGLNSDILLAEQRVIKEMSEALEMERQARKDQDEKSAEEQRQYRETMKKKIEYLNQERKDLKVSLEEMKEQRRRFKVLEGKYKESQERVRQQDKKIESLEKEGKQRKSREEDMLRQTEEATRELASLRLQLSERGNATMGISSMRPRSSGSQYVGDSSYVRLFLSGTGYFFGGKSGYHGYYSADLTRLTDENDKRRICALGTNGSWLYHYHTGSNLNCWTCWSDSFPTEYPKLAAWLDKHQMFGCPRHISLGPDGNFYIAMMDSSVKWCIPKSVSETITAWINKRTIRSIQRLWLGYNNNYVAEISDAEYFYRVDNYKDLKSHMESLELEIGLDYINSERPPIKQLAMNIEAPRGFVLIRDGGEVFWHKGISGNQFDEAKLQRFKNDNENSW
ncbi:uncharacterized protein FFB20_14350 [Fusarium fujikuroi]|nr:uncharacterized protein Y057_2085 [Fusarium fujikuroi]SCN99055.1 uncharacterized protein FFE2_09234 [Fusarium fujikuroi]SCO08070.1 uncharacterized protein FFC1_10618 [Fusarium fujikuroi]SCO13662.1 uncharacterized protein FFB20_14350 [Fusarium fujikuroi]SCO44209.1 uncharacterized protein FFNC_09694 [Fusarium fujikuroi]